MIQKLKKNNKGFTLVELIVVIAILGVLAAVLVPQYIQYVEKSRVAADKSTASMIEQAVNTLCADGTIAADEVFTWTTATGVITTSLSTGGHVAEVTAITGTIGAAKSKVAKTAATVTYTVTFTNNVPKVAVAPNYSAWA